MQVMEGDLVRLRDGRTVGVTDAASQEPDDYRVYSIDAYERDGSFVVNDEMPVEKIFVGVLEGTNITVVSDMSEVVSILNI